MNWGILLTAMAIGISTCISSPATANDKILGPIHGPITLPRLEARVVSFRTIVDVGNRQTAGYVPVRIEFIAPATLAADRRLTYRFQSLPTGETPPRRILTIDVPILVEQGTKQTTFVRYLPKWTAGQSVEVSIIEDGQLVDGCDIRVGRDFRDQRNFGGFFGGNGFGHHWLSPTEHSANWILVSEGKKKDWLGLPDPRVVIFGAPTSQEWTSLSVNQRESVSQLLGRNFEHASPAELPNDWRAYQSHDCIVASENTINEITAIPLTIAAIRGWVLNGGCLAIYNVTSPAETMERLQFSWIENEMTRKRVEVLASRENSEFRNQIEQQKEFLALRFPSQDLFDEKKLSEETGSIEPQEWINLGFEGQSIEAVVKSHAEQLAYWDRMKKTPRIPPSEMAELFRIQDVGAGRVILIDGGVSNENTNDAHIALSWAMVRKAISDRISPIVRRGVDPMIGNSRFSDWLISGVSQPPVYTFIGLLTAFVVLVGPIAYRQTAKRGRSYLMFGIAPILAFATTILMFGYGIVSDGFGTIVRVRQLTWVDGASGDAGERIRATYFAGVRPSNGLRFPGDAEVMGYPNTNRLSWEEQHELAPSTIGRVVIGDDRQVFDSSFLPSREQRQFVTHRPRQNIGALEFAVSENAGSPPRVTNAFAFTLRKAVLRDEDGKYWKIGSLNPGETKQCDSWPEVPEGTVPLKNVDTPSRTMGRLFNDYRPLAPAGLRSANRSSGRTSRNRTFDLISRINREMRGKTMPNGIFEYQIQSWLRDESQIPIFHFVAIADADPDDLAIEECEIVESVRYVFGTMR